MAERDLNEPREVTPFQMFDKGSNASYGVTHDFRPKRVKLDETEEIISKATKPTDEQLQLFGNDPVVAPPSEQPDMAGASKAGHRTGGAAKD